MSVCMNSLAVLPGSWFLITAKRQSSIMAAGKTSSSMKPIRSWQNATIEIFYNRNRIASHRRLKGRPGQYSTITEHMPEDHQKYLEWNGDRFRKWAEQIGASTYTAVNAILTSKGVEQQTADPHRKHTASQEVPTITGGKRI